MIRKEQAEEAAMTELVKTYNGTSVDYFVMGVEWADKNPQNEVSFILDLIHQRSIAFDEAKTYREKLEIAIEALKYLEIHIDDEGEYVREVLEKLK